MASDLMKKNNKVRIANLIGDRRLMNYVWEYHGLTEDQSFHDYIFITNDKKYEFKNINTAATDVASRLSVSDTTVYKIFEEAVDFKRLPLSSVISIDEVYMKLTVNISTQW